MQVSPLLSQTLLTIDYRLFATMSLALYQKSDTEYLHAELDDTAESLYRILGEELDNKCHLCIIIAY